MRLFIAIPIPADIKVKLAGLHKPVENIRWVPQNQMHLTLKFAGRFDHKQTGLLKSELETIPFNPFELKLEGVGFFPDKGMPRVYWAGVTHNGSLAELQKMVEDAAVKAGAGKDRFRYNPHITLGRVKSGKLNKEELKKSAGDFHSRVFTVQKFILFESQLKPEGAIHKVVAEYPHK